MIVQPKRRHPRYPDLSPRQRYHVLGVEADHFRILNDHGRPYLYPPTLFTVVDRHDGDGWVSTVGSDGERYAYPPPLNKPGFFEDYFDGVPKAIATFWRIVNQHLVAG